MTIKICKETRGQVVRFGAEPSIDHIHTARSLQFIEGNNEVAAAAPVMSANLELSSFNERLNNTVSMVIETPYPVDASATADVVQEWDYNPEPVIVTNEEAARIQSSIEQGVTWAEYFSLNETVTWSTGATGLRVKFLTRQAYIYGKYPDFQNLIDFFRIWNFASIDDLIADLGALQDLMTRSRHAVNVSSSQHAFIIADQAAWADNAIMRFISSSRQDLSADTNLLCIGDWTIHADRGIYLPFDHRGRITQSDKIELWRKAADRGQQPREYTDWTKAPGPRFGCLDIETNSKIDLDAPGNDLMILPLISEGSIPRGNSLLIPIQCGLVFKNGKLLGHTRNLTVALDHNHLLDKALAGQLTKPIFQHKGVGPLVFKSFTI